MGDSPESGMALHPEHPALAPAPAPVPTSDSNERAAAALSTPLSAPPVPGAGSSAVSPVRNSEPTGAADHEDLQAVSSAPIPARHKQPTGLAYIRAAHNSDSRELKGSTTRLSSKPSPSPSLPAQEKAAESPPSAQASPALSRTLQAGALLVAATLVVLVLEPLQLTTDSSSRPPALAHIRPNTLHAAGLLRGQSVQHGEGRPVPVPPSRGASGRSGAKKTQAARGIEAAQSLRTQAAHGRGKGARTKGRPWRKQPQNGGAVGIPLAPGLLILQRRAPPRQSALSGPSAIRSRWRNNARAGAQAGAQAEASVAEAPTMPPIPGIWALHENGTEGALSDGHDDSSREAALGLEDLPVAPAMSPAPSRRLSPRNATRRFPMRPPRPWNVSAREWDERKWEEPVPVQNISELLQRVDWYERRYFWAERGANPKATPLKGLAFRSPQEGRGKGSGGKGNRGKGDGGAGSGGDLVQDVFGKGKKYYWVIGGGDKCAGESHFSWSFTCVAAEARLLNRTFVLDPELCLHPVHNFGKMVINPLAAYYNVENMVKRQPMIALPLFTLALDQQLRTPGAPNVSLKAYGWTQKVEQVQREEATILVRDVGLNGYAYRICDYRGHVIHRDWRVLGHANALWGIVLTIEKSMGWDFDAVHIRRGDKLDPSRWPHLDFDTQPAQLLKKLPHFIRPGRRIYISTNERTPGFFAPLRRKYRVHMLRQYKHLWSNRSHWYKWSRTILKESHGFDVRMQAIVDYLVFKFARTKVETFNDLTDDPKHGI